MKRRSFFAFILTAPAVLRGLIEVGASPAMSAVLNEGYAAPTLTTEDLYRITREHFIPVLKGNLYKPTPFLQMMMEKKKLTKRQRDWPVTKKHSEVNHEAP